MRRRLACWLFGHLPIGGPPRCYRCLRRIEFHDGRGKWLTAAPSAEQEGE